MMPLGINVAPIRKTYSPRDLAPRQAKALRRLPQGSRPRLPAPIKTIDDRRFSHLQPLPLESPIYDPHDADVKRGTKKV